MAVGASRKPVRSGIKVIIDFMFNLPQTLVAAHLQEK